MLIFAGVAGLPTLLKKKVFMNRISIQNFIGGFIAGCIGGAAAGFFCTDFSDAYFLGGCGADLSAWAGGSILESL